MIDIAQYRNRIGIFNNSKLMKMRNHNISVESKFHNLKSRKLISQKMSIFLKIFLLVATSILVYKSATEYKPDQVFATPSTNLKMGGELENVKTQLWVEMLGNFYARYLYGNVKQPKGVSP
jgi:hypothetical protein